MDTISWRSKLAQRRSILFSHDPRADIYLNILQPGQSRASIFKSRLCSFMICEHPLWLMVNTVLQWWTASRSQKALMLAGESAWALQKGLETWLSCRHVSVIPGCSPESLGLPRMSNYWQSSGKTRAICKEWWRSQDSQTFYHSVVISVLQPSG